LIKDYTDRRRWRKEFRGYTLVELLAVSAIISILAAMSFALFSRMRSQVVETNALAALNSIATGYEMYYFVNRTYPHWGPDQEFDSPTGIIDHMIDEEFLPRSWSDYLHEPATDLIYNITQDYAVEIPVFNPDDPTTSSGNSFFIIFRPYNYQRDSLAIGTNPLTGWVAIRPRRGRNNDDYRTYGIYTFHRIGAD
jgi:prepilin-type N-terminal cleavage/methylation domain-containing protein